MPRADRASRSAPVRSTPSSRTGRSARPTFRIASAESSSSRISRPKGVMVTGPSTTPVLTMTPPPWPSTRMLSPMRIASSAVALEAVPATCAASAGTTTTASAMPREDSAASTPRTRGVAMLSTVLLTRMLLGKGVGGAQGRIGRAPAGGVAGPWSHLEAALPRICDRDTDHGPSPSGCRIMARMPASFLPSEAAGEPPVVLHVRTRRIEEAVDLLGHVPAAVSGAWLRHGQGMVALGTDWSVQAGGPHRFAAAGSAFRALAARARVDDEVRVRTSGLIALGSFSYADGSPRPSTLMVPRALLGVHYGE